MVEYRMNIFMFKLAIFAFLISESLNSLIPGVTYHV